MNQGYEEYIKKAARDIEIPKFVGNDHISWIAGHLQSKDKKPTIPDEFNILRTEGRKVIIASLLDNNMGAIPIPSIDDYKKWTEAWLSVYQLCELTLYNNFKELLNKNYVSKRYNEIACPSGKTYYLPQDSTSVEYITILENIVVDTLATLKKRVNPNVVAMAKRAQDVKSDVNVSVVPKSPIKVAKKEVTVGMTEAFAQRVRAQNSASVRTSPVVSKDEPSNVIEVNIPKKEVEREEAVPSVFENEEIVSELKGLKIPDHDKLNKDDIEKIIEEKPPFVLVTCADLSKERNLFCYNAEKCLEAGLSIGAYINGKAKDSDGALKDSKKALEMMRDYQIGGPVIYEINNEYLRTHDSEEDFDNIINAYNGVASILTEQGYPVLVAIENDNAILLERHIKRKNIPVVFPIVYRIVPHELKEIPQNGSIALMDPQYDNDIIVIRNPQFEIKKQEVKQAA